MDSATVSALNVGIDPHDRLYALRDRIPWDDMPSEVSEQLRPLLWCGVAGWARDDPWAWSAFDATVGAWTPEFARAVRDLGHLVAHPLIGAVLLAAVMSKGAEGPERRPLAASLARAHREWARTVVLDAPARAWQHYSYAWRVFSQYGFLADADEIELEVHRHAVTLLADTSTAAIGACDVLGAICESRRGPQLGNNALSAIAAELERFATVADFTWRKNAIVVVRPISRYLARDTSALDQLLVDAHVDEATRRRHGDGSALAEASLLRRALKLAVEKGLGREQIDELNELLRSASLRSMKQMKPVRIEVPLPEDFARSREEHVAALSEILKRDPVGAIQLSAFWRAPSMASIADGISAAGKLPVDVFGGFYVDHDRSGAEITAENRVVSSYVDLYFALEFALFAHVVREAGTAALRQALAAGPSGRSFALVDTAVQLYDAGNHAAATALLVPEVEANLRDLIRRSGAPRTAWQGRQREKSLGPLVNTLREVLPTHLERVGDFLHCMVGSEDGFNLRNRVLHGLVDPDMVTQVHSTVALQCLVLVNSLQIRSAAPEDVVETE